MDTNKPNDFDRPELDNVHHLYGEDHKIYNESFDGRESWPRMLENLYKDMGRLWEKERRVISTELSEKIADVKVASASMVLGGMFVFVGVVCAAATAIIILNQLTSLWLASLIVTVGFSAIGGLMVNSARKKFDAESLKPQHSIEAFSEIRETLQERIHELKKH